MRSAAPRLPGPRVLVIARIVIGVAIGLASAAAPVYISEVAPPESRGRLVSFFQLAVTIGILVAYLVGLAFDDIEGWRWMLGLGCVPALALGFGMLRMPQSPRWLVMCGQEYRARAILAKIREDDPEKIDEELEEIERSVAQDKPGDWRDLLDPVVRAALVVGSAGDPAAGDRDQHGHLLRADDRRIHRRQLLRRLDPRRGRGRHHQRRDDPGGAAAARPRRPPAAADRGHGRDGHLAVALALTFIAGAGSTAGSIVAIVSLMAYVASFAISLGPIFWLLNAEIYPLAVRSKAAGLGTMANWTFNFIVSLTFLLLIDALGRAGASLLLRGDLRGDAGLLLEVRPRDQGQAPRGHPGDLPRAGGRGISCPGPSPPKSNPPRAPGLEGARAAPRRDRRGNHLRELFAEDQSAASG